MIFMAIGWISKRWIFLKVRHSMWRFCNDSLPVRATLHVRHIMDVGSCLWCPDHNETVFHSLMGCERIQPLWKKCECEEMVKGSDEWGLLS